MKKPTKYNHLEIQEKWNKKWEAQKIYHPDLDNAKNPYYSLYMFPYPSAEGLHIGHAFSGTGADVYSRFKRMKGQDVFQPMGFDAFGIHSENFAIKINDHPQNLINRATKKFRKQFDSLGFSYDWSHTVNTSDPNYYKWTQWLFIQLFKAGLAEKKKARVNWCPSCKTVLADEQVISKENSKLSRSSGIPHSRGQIVNSEPGDQRTRVCERCGTEVEWKDLEQWFFKITKYADRLLEGLDRIDWTEKVKLAQKNWIGKKEGINIEYQIEGSAEKIRVFTTRPDTNFGATFIALAPEHSLALKLATKEHKQNVSEYIKRSKSKSDRERMEEGREKTGIFTGSYAINNLNQEKMPVWISDFVLMGFGTGALVGVPGHDKRDFQFAQKFGLPIKRVVIGKDGDQSEIKSIEQVQEDQGTMINSEFLNGLDIHKAIARVIDHIQEKGWGKKEIHYHLRDWLISRQRYWGAPIPMVFCATDGWQPVAEDDLPVLLPYLENFRPLGTGTSPLDQDKEFVNTTCPKCNGPAKRETDVADTFLDSSWYFLRYPSTDFDNKAFDQDRTKKWLPVNSYIGGAEHSVLHLLYSRFVTKVLFDLKLLDFDEPFSKFRAHGLIIKDGAKMSKSRGNVVNPDEYIARYGADSLRCYLMFLGPFDQGGDFRDSGIEGMERFLKRVRTLSEYVVSSHSAGSGQKNQSRKESASFSANSKIEQSLNKTIKGVSSDVENLRYNTALAKIMELVNDLSSSNRVKRDSGDSIKPEYIKILLLLLAPFAPYITEELWSQLDDSASIHKQSWPSYDEANLKEDKITIAIQINGKLRDVLMLENDIVSTQEKIEQLARESSKVKVYLERSKVKKIIYVPGKILNFVAD